MKIVLLIIAVFGAVCNADKIIGGTAAVLGQFPSIVYQTKSGMFFCDGTIISDVHVLTAAHCEQSLYSLSVVAGTTSRDTGGRFYTVVGKDVYPSYNSRTAEGDIMILKIATTFQFSDGSTAPANLALESPATGAKITVAGWGDTNPGFVQSLAIDLQYVDVSVIDTDTCNSAASYDGSVKPGMICIGEMNGEVDSCQGDSGGPAYLQGTSTLIGIVSWGNGCAQPMYPGVYTDVAFYTQTEWLQGYM